MKSLRITGLCSVIVFLSKLFRFWGDKSVLQLDKALGTTALGERYRFQTVKSV
jgi:hypothetical protein